MFARRPSHFEDGYKLPYLLEGQINTLQRALEAEIVHGQLAKELNELVVSRKSGELNIYTCGRDCKELVCQTNTGCYRKVL